jgi:hypothetical protein
MSKRMRNTDSVKQHHCQKTEITVNQKKIPTAPLLMFFTAFVVLFPVSCAAPLKEFYPDSYFTEDGIYQNRPIGFTLVFRGNWDIVTDPMKMEKGSRAFAGQLLKSGADLLFVGTTSEKTQGVRGIAINLNIPCEEYAERIRKINAPDITSDSGLTAQLLNNLPMVRWDYTVGEFRFVEFFFTLDTYNVRIAFWSKPAIFERFENIYLDIISSLSFVGRL